MNDNVSPAIPRSFTIIASIAVAWNLIGVLTYIGQVTMTPETIAQLPAAQQPLYQNIPLWATSAYAIAVHGSVIGSVLLLLHKAWALPVFVISLVAVLVQFGHAIFMTELVAVSGLVSLILPAVIVVIAVFLIWYARHAQRQGWIS